jgi:hypothetical protein
MREQSASSGGSTMSAFETIKAAYAAFGRNDPSVLFAAMDSGINWNEAEGITDAGSGTGAGRMRFLSGICLHISDSRHVRTEAIDRQPLHRRHLNADNRHAAVIR